MQIVQPTLKWSFFVYVFRNELVTASSGLSSSCNSNQNSTITTPAPHTIEPLARLDRLSFHSSSNIRSGDTVHQHATSKYTLTQHDHHTALLFSMTIAPRIQARADQHYPFLKSQTHRHGYATSTTGITPHRKKPSTYVEDGEQRAQLAGLEHGVVGAGRAPVRTESGAWAAGSLFVVSKGESSVAFVRGVWGFFSGPAFLVYLVDKPL